MKKTNTKQTKKNKKVVNKNNKVLSSKKKTKTTKEKSASAIKNKLKSKDVKAKKKVVKKATKPNVSTRKNTRNKITKSTNKKSLNNINEEIDYLLKYDSEVIDADDSVYKKYNETNNRFKNKKLSILLLINIVLVICLVLVGLLKSNNNSDNTSSAEKEVIEILPKEADPMFKETYDEFYSRAFVSEDYVGQIIFDSGIINEPIMQGDTNETYLRRNFETYKYEVCGPVFMDYICDKESDQNLILYGHNRSTSVDPEHVMMFSPLHVLEKEENYEENKLIYLALEDRVDVYLVASVYPVKVVEKEDGNQYLVKGEPKYYLNNYSVEEFYQYYESIKQKQLYNTGVKLVNTDKLLTLQTCYENKLDKLIILAKKIESIPY